MNQPDRHERTRRGRAPAYLPIIKLIIVPIVWGGALTAGRVVSAELPAFTLTCLRFMLAGSLLLPALRLKEGRFPRLGRAGAGWLALLTLVGIVMFNYLLFTSLQTITAIRSSVLLAFAPAIVTTAAFFVFREPVTVRKLFGIGLAAAGAILTIVNGDLQGLLAEGLAVGDLFMVGAVAAWAGYSLLIKQALKYFTPLALMGYGSVLGVVFLLPLTLTEAGSWPAVLQLSAAAVGSLLYLSFGAAGLAYLWYFEGIRAVGSSKASVFLNLEPVAAIGSGILLLGEHLTLAAALGAILVIGGLYLAAGGRQGEGRSKG